MLFRGNNSKFFKRITVGFVVKESQHSKLYKKLCFFILVFAMAAVFLFLAKTPVFAQGNNANTLMWGGQEGEVQTNLGLGNTDPRIIVAKIVNVFLGFLGIVAVLLIMYAGFLWMTAGGDESKIAQAKQILVNALIGLVIILASFGIVAFIMNKFFGASLFGPGSGTTPGGGIPGGVGALGNCTVEMVYPEPDQKEVPRNTVIIISFREAIDSATIIDPGNLGHIWTDGRIKLYKSSDDPDVPGNWITDVAVTTADNLTFVLDPAEYLGSASEYIKYSVYFSNSIEKVSGGGIFDTCRTDYFRWEFEVSNKIDLESPKILDGGVFPPPDNGQDATSSSAAVQAAGAVNVLVQPQVRISGSIGAPSANGSAPAASISNINNAQTQAGTLRMAIASDDVTASLQNVNTSQLLGSAVVSGDSVVFPGYFTLTLNNATDDFSSGNSWDLAASAAVTSDTLTVGSNVFAFVSGAAGLNEIQVGASTAQTATNIATKLNALSLVNASSAGNLVTVSAETAGLAGNSILLSASRPSVLAVTPLTGGLGSNESVTVVNRRDKPKNAIIQINFNEAVNPVTLSGDATLIVNYIAVKCLSVGGAACDPSQEGFFACGADVCLEGNFVMSNAYKTVEFISNKLCGVNGCGEQIFCLPGNSELRVELTAANFTDCGTDACASRSPYNFCAGSNCQDTSGKNFPQAGLPLDGIVDTALNSLDGDRSDTAEGPAGTYNENSTSPAPPAPPAPGSGDNFIWSFFISNKIEIAPPAITSTNPANSAGGIPLSGSVEMVFNKLMMSASLKTGGISIFNGKSRVAHRLINLKSLNNQTIGYWVTKKDFDTSTPSDGEADYSSAEIRHTTFPSSTSLRSQAGSGIKDIYQNCFKPSAGPACPGVNAANPTCCSGILSASPSCP